MTDASDAAATASLPPGWDCHVHVFDAQSPVQSGHYQPATRSLQEIEAVAAAHGVGHLVLVQPSVYGTDNSLLLRALKHQPGRHRGVAVVDAQISDTELDTLHAAGVRGVRFNRVSPVGHQGDPTPALLALAPRLRERGWHVQWYLRSDELALLPPLQAQAGLPFVLDHLGGLRGPAQGLAADDPAWTHAATLAAAGAWIKLSGWYRLGAGLPYTALHGAVQRVATLFDQRMLWGSDWPHTGQPSEPALPYAATWEPVMASLDARAATRVRSGSPQALYGA